MSSNPSSPSNRHLSDREEGEIGFEEDDAEVHLSVPTIPQPPVVLPIPPGRRWDPAVLGITRHLPDIARMSRLSGGANIGIRIPKPYCFSGDQDFGHPPDITLPSPMITRIVSGEPMCEENKGTVNKVFYFFTDMLIQHSPVWKLLLCQDKETCQESRYGENCLSLEHEPWEVVQLLLELIANPTRCLRALDQQQPPDEKTDKQEKSSSDGHIEKKKNDQDSNANEIGFGMDNLTLSGDPSLLERSTRSGYPAEYALGSSAPSSPPIGRDEPVSPLSLFVSALNVGKEHSNQEFNNFVLSPIFVKLMECVEKYDMVHIKSVMSHSLYTLRPCPKIIQLLERFEMKDNLEYWVPEFADDLIHQSQLGRGGSFYGRNSQDTLSTETFSDSTRKLILDYILSNFENYCRQYLSDKTIGTCKKMGPQPGRFGPFVSNFPHY